MRTHQVPQNPLNVSTCFLSFHSITFIAWNIHEISCKFAEAWCLCNVNESRYTLKMSEIILNELTLSSTVYMVASSNNVNVFINFKENSLVMIKSNWLFFCSTEKWLESQWTKKGKHAHDVNVWNNTQHVPVIQRWVSLVHVPFYDPLYVGGIMDSDKISMQIDPFICAISTKNSLNWWRGKKIYSE